MSTPARVLAVQNYFNQVWHLTSADHGWSLCGRRLGGPAAQTSTVSNVPKDERTCKHCLRRFESQ